MAQHAKVLLLTMCIPLWRQCTLFQMDNAPCLKACIVSDWFP
uniref:Uncharacterized protein n=1 Tax=Anguilla anguilla TaxID=7936 RepID=A0A0E9SJ91_ANGAN